MFKNKLKEIIDNKAEGIDSNNKKKIENLVFFVIILIITIVMINYVWNGNKGSNKTITNSAGKQLATTQNIQIQGQSEINTNSNLEQRLETILSNISGVGNVKVFLNYSESSETVAMYN